jgi:hypothetical protein
MRRKTIGTLAAVSVFALTGCSGHHPASRSKQASNPSDEPAYAAYATSPDGKRVAVVVLDGSNLRVGPAAGGATHIVYRDAYSITNVAWASPHLIAFGDGFEVNAIDLRTRSVNAVALASNFTISSDRRWIAWSKDVGPELPETVGMVPVTGGVCLVPPRPANKQDSSAFFKPGVKRLFFTRWPFGGNTGPTGFGGVISVRFSRLRPGAPSECH